MTDDKKLCVCGCNKNVFDTWSPPAGECVQMTDDKGRKMELNWGDIILVAIVSMSVSFAITTSIFYMGMR